MKQSQIFTNISSDKTYCSGFIIIPKHNALFDLTTYEEVERYITPIGEISYLNTIHSKLIETFPYNLTKEDVGKVLLGFNAFIKENHSVYNIEYKLYKELCKLKNQIKQYDTEPRTS